MTNVYVSQLFYNQVWLRILCVTSTNTDLAKRSPTVSTLPVYSLSPLTHSLQTRQHGQIY